MTEREGRKGARAEQSPGYANARGQGGFGLVQQTNKVAGSTEHMGWRFLSQLLVA